MSQGVEPLGNAPRMGDVVNLLAEKLQLLRLERGLTLRQAAELAGVAKETISDLEHGRRKPFPPTLYKIATGYGIPPRELLERTPLEQISEPATEEEPATPLTQAPSLPEATEDAEELDDDPESLRRKNRLLIWTIDYQREEIEKPLRSRIEEIEAENERLKKVLKSGLVEKMVAAEAGVPSGTEGGRRMVHCHRCGWWLVAETWEVMEAWGNEKERASEEGGNG